MGTTMEHKHPDLFTAEEAVVYLHADSERTLQNLRDNFGLVGYTGLGKGLRYWRDDLDAAILRLIGKIPASKVSKEKREPVRLAQ